MKLKVLAGGQKWEEWGGGNSHCRVRNELWSRDGTVRQAQKSSPVATASKMNASWPGIVREKQLRPPYFGVTSSVRKSIVICGFSFRKEGLSTQ